MHAERSVGMRLEESEERSERLWRDAGVWARPQGGEASGRLLRPIRPQQGDAGIDWIAGGRGGVWMAHVHACQCVERSYACAV